MPGERKRRDENAVPPASPPGAGAARPGGDGRTKIVEALMALVAERAWDDISLIDIAERAGVSLADFRDAFPSKGAVLAGFSRMMDRVVLEGSSKELEHETPKERLFDVLMRRLDAMAPYRMGLEGVRDHVRRDPLAAAALNQTAINSMRFMLAAAGIESEGAAGSLKLQGLVLAWSRVLEIWLDDHEPGLARTMAALDRELTRGSHLAARVDDLDRLAQPLRAIGRAVIDTQRRMRDTFRGRARRDEGGRESDTEYTRAP